MKILISSDVFDLAQRVKLLDKNYHILYDTDKGKYLLYYGSQYALNLGNKLHGGALNKILYTRVENSNKIFDAINAENEKNELKKKEMLKDYSTYAFSSIYSYANSHSNKIDFTNIKLF